MWNAGGKFKKNNSNIFKPTDWKLVTCKTLLVAASHWLMTRRKKTAFCHSSCKWSWSPSLHCMHARSSAYPGKAREHFSSRQTKASKQSAELHYSQPSRLECAHFWNRKLHLGPATSGSMAGTLMGSTMQWTYMSSLWLLAGCSQPSLN